MRQIEWAYLAGLIDGEGCISTRLLKNKNPLPRIYLTQGRYGRSIMVWIENHVGVGHVKDYKTNHRWSVTKISEIRYVLEGVLPYLVLKTHQAFLALESCDSTKLSQERRMEIHQELKESKRKEV